MGISWGVGAFSTAKYGGAKLSDVLRSLLLNEEGEEGKKLLDALEEGEDDDFHVHFYGVDGMAASIPLYKALNRSIYYTEDIFLFSL